MGGMLVTSRWVYIARLPRLNIFEKQNFANKNTLLLIISMVVHCIIHIYSLNPLLQILDLKVPFFYSDFRNHGILPGE